MVRILAAFVAGLVLALAGALVYVRVHDRQQQAQQESTQVAPGQNTAPLPDAEPQAAQPPPMLPDTADAAPTTAASEVSSPAAHSTAKRHEPARRKSTAKQAQEPVQVVQNTAPNSPIGGKPESSYPGTNEDLTTATPAPTPQQNTALPQPHVVELAAGTNLVIRLGEAVSTDHNYTDDAFRGFLDEPIVRNGFIIADKGSKVLGRIVEADKAGHVRGVASLRLALTEINTTDGQRIGVTTNDVEKEGVKTMGRDAAKIAGGAALGAIIGALGGGGKGAAIGAGAGGAAGTGVVLATRGKAATLPSESRLTFQLSEPVTITEKLNH